MDYPRMFRMSQRFEDRILTDIPETIRKEIDRLNPSELIRPNQSVAVAVGSRGIDNHGLIVKSVIDELLALDAKPFIVTAMGSHGGATDEGQAAILAGYGITEETMGVPVRSSMDVIQIGTTDFGMPVFFGRIASEADHIVLVNRIKPHTRFAGEIESGMLKMMAIGLGKRIGAETYHRNFVHYSFDRVVRSVYKIVMQEMPIAFGIGIIENGYQQTAEIKAIGRDNIEQEERELLRMSRAWCPKLPFDDVDLLIIDEIGKDISGAGMDTSVTGLKKIFCPELVHSLPRVNKIFVRDLSKGTGGNAMGLGLADFTTKRLVDKIDFNSFYTNALTAQNLRGAKIPMFFKTDKEVLDAAFKSFGLIEPRNAKILWIKNTLQISEVEASISYRDRARTRPDITLLSEPRFLEFLPDGNLPDFVLSGEAAYQTV
ncbi:lactate racemase domain-containing protein [Tumidithrix elongata RA019]|uniref:Lactate racemase domain-containing protein n=1 Tax=Tumidithrix elongata BACA0141 TaxID=2716417 RepID=A0AAW9PQS3_9CYAN|nr:lactate racemase domain-containing protein [Tumidithrix elongata RA019]